MFFESVRRFFKSVGLFLFFSIFSGVISVFAGDRRDWDFLNYHFYDGYAFWNDRLNIDLAPASAWSFFNPLLDGVYYGLVVFFHTQWEVLFASGFLGGWGVFLFYRLCGLFFEKNPGVEQGLIRYFFTLCAFVLGISSPFILRGLGSSESDFQSASFVILSLYFVVKGRFIFPERSIFSRMEWLFYGGVALGCASGFKLTNLPSVLALSLAFFSDLKFRKESLYLIGFFCVGGSLGFLMVNGAWMWIIYTHFKNPIFPYYNAFFHSPYVAWVNMRDEYALPGNMWDVIRRPFQYLSIYNFGAEGFFEEGRLAVGLILSLCYGVKILIFGRERSKNYRLIRFTLIYVWLLYLIWILQFGIYRYAMPLSLMMSLLIILILSDFVDSERLSRVFSSWEKMVVVGVIVFLMMFYTTYPQIFSRPLAQPYLQVEPHLALPVNSLVVLSDTRESFIVPFLVAPEVAFVTTRMSMPSTLNIPFPLGIQKVLKHQGPLFVVLGRKSQGSHQSLVAFAHAAHPSVLSFDGVSYEVENFGCVKLTTTQFFQKFLYVCPVRKWWVVQDSNL